jgi:hypothetical protein
MLLYFHYRVSDIWCVNLYLVYLTLNIIFSVLSSSIIYIYNDNASLEFIRMNMLGR